MRILALLVLAAPALAQGAEAFSHLVVPQARAWPVDRRAEAIRIERVEARVRILERAATTSLEVSLHNPARRDAEAVLLLPVPDGAAISSFLFEGPAPEPTARLLPKEEARREYDAIVAKLRDPALLEFAGLGLVRSSVFPVPAGGRQRVRVVYEHILPADGDRVDYVLPRSESLLVQVPWSIAVEVVAKVPVTAYSPSHEISVRPSSDGRRLSVSVAGKHAVEPGSFRLSLALQRERGGVAASLFAYPDPRAGGGYFLLFAGVPDDAARKPAIRREVTVVLDRSGSMAGPKMDQARAAALQVLEGLEPGEAFNVIDYSTTVAAFAERPVTKTPETTARAREYLASLRAIGGTNLHDALVEALRQPATEGMLPIVLFLTDGLPTVGRTAETVIREAVERGNPHRRRVFTFGVGHDVNAPLLDRLAELTRATSAYVQPDEDVELKVAQAFRRLSGPVFADPRLETLDPDGAVTTRRVGELVPAAPPDLFEGDQLVLLGQYRGAEPLRFRLSGNLRGETRAFEFTFGLDTATTRNGFVPRLWAARRIAFLIDQVRQLGASDGGPRAAGTSPLADPRAKELVDEIVRLSTEFGILTEYTSFLATEGTDLGDRELLLEACGKELEGKAIRARWGKAAVARALDNNERKSQTAVQVAQAYLDEGLARVPLAGVQPMCDRAFFKRGAQWLDANAAAAPAPLSRVVEFGSEDYARLLDALVAEGRQGLLAFQGEIVLHRGGENILVRNPSQE